MSQVRLEAVRARLLEIAAQGKAIDLQETALQASFEELSNLPKLWPHLSEEDKLAKFRTIINKVAVDYDKPGNRLGLKMELFLDPPNSQKNEGFELVCIPGRRDRDSSRRPA